MQSPNHHQSSLKPNTRLGLLLAFALISGVSTYAAEVGLFESAADIGKSDLKGSSEYLADKATYRITGSGKNIWFAEDACQFLSKKMSGDSVFSMDVEWEAEGREPHRKDYDPFAEVPRVLAELRAAIAESA